jgi:hypothetical protein
VPTHYALPDVRYAIAFLAGFVVAGIVSFVAGIVCLEHQAGALDRAGRDTEARVSAERATCASSLAEERRAVQRDADERLVAVCVHPEMRAEACRGR